MKAPAFWFSAIGWQAKALRPLSYGFQFGGLLRKLITRPYTASVPVICVGNIVVGGSGKTPTCVALAQMLLQQNAKPVFVTRGYGGSERGPLRVDPDIHTAVRVGDEALLLAQTAPVWIGRDRASAIRMAEKEATHIIMDDGLQNPSIKPQIKFLVIDAEVGIGNGLILPAGPLRENLDAALQRIDAVILVGEHDAQNIAQDIHRPILHAKIIAELPEFLHDGQQMDDGIPPPSRGRLGGGAFNNPDDGNNGWPPPPAPPSRGGESDSSAFTPDFQNLQKVFCFAGIGRPEKFYQSCRALGLEISGTHDFADHHLFTENELQDLERAAQGQNAKLFTTEKDWVRLSTEWQKRISFLPIKLVFDIPELPKSYFTAT